MEPDLSMHDIFIGILEARGFIMDQLDQLEKQVWKCNACFIRV